MTDSESFTATALSISLTVRDVQESAAWYRDVLGFAEAQRHEHDGTLRAVSLAAGAARILINQDDGAKGLNRQKGEGFSFQLTTKQNVDEIAARIRAHGGALVTEPADMPWGTRAFRLVDPDGFRMSISSEKPDR
jgi:uncharacterized glyoxalase superfamily protein PhnB